MLQRERVTAMIRKIGQAFVLDPAHTTYAFSILPGGHPEHLY